MEFLVFSYLFIDFIFNNIQFIEKYLNIKKFLFYIFFINYNT